MRIVYIISSQLWKSARWIWTAIIVTLAVGIAINLFSGVSTAGVIGGVLNWLVTPQPGISDLPRILTLSAIGLFVCITLLSGLITVLFRKRYEDKPSYNPPPEIKAMLDYLESDVKLRTERDAAQKNRDEKALERYLRTIKEANQSISSKGFENASPTMISADVPLEAVFVPLQAISDRPVFDEPVEQQRQFEAIRQLNSLSDTARDAYIQRLRSVWHSQLGLKRSEMPQSVPDNEILRRLTPGHPAAIILGTPGSGKSTMLKRVALYMASASLVQVASFTALGPVQIPLLIHLRVYAASLEKDSLSVKQFIAAQASKTEPQVATKLLDELSQGRCLVLFDGLDEITDARMRGYVTEELSEFIAEYTSEERETRKFNRFLVTSRIMGYEPLALARYAHYTLLDFNTEQINQFLTNWCTAIERYLGMSAHGMKELTEAEKVRANQAGIEQRDRLLSLLKQTPDLRQLAVNPLMLTLITLFHASGRSFPSQRIELYHIAVHILLTSWNWESGRATLSPEDIPLAELLLGAIAYHLQNKFPVIAERDLYTLTRETIAGFDQGQASVIKVHDTHHIIETLRRIGLLVEIGEQFFSLAFPTFQSYFVARYLLGKSQQERKQFVLDHCLQAAWHEPLLLMIVDMNSDDSAAGQQAVNELLQVIKDTTGSYDTWSQQKSKPT